MTGWGALAPAKAAGLGQEELQELEALLERLGFAPGPVDGVADEDTRAAIGRYQTFALLDGPSEPTMALLLELRAVEEALTTLGTDKTPQAAALEQTPAETIPPEDPPHRPDALPGTEAASAVEPEADPDPDPAPAAAPLADELFPEKPGIGGEGLESVPGRQEILALLTPYKAALASGELLAGELARSFNREGQADYEKGLYERAIARFGAAIHLDPGFAAAFHNRGTAYEAAGWRSLATADFERAFELGFGRLDLSGPQE